MNWEVKYQAYISIRMQKETLGQFELRFEKAGQNKKPMNKGRETKVFVGSLQAMKRDKVVIEDCEHE